VFDANSTPAGVVSDADTGAARAQETPAEAAVTVRAAAASARRGGCTETRSDVVVRRLSSDPVVAAGSVAGYGAIFNAGVIHHDDRYHLFARGVRSGYTPNPARGAGEPRFLDYVSDLLVFASRDGLAYEFRQVLHSSGADAVYEDPRIQVVVSDGEPHFVLSYTHVPARTTGRPWRGALSQLSYRDDAFTLGEALLLGPEQVPNKDVVLCNLDDGRIALIQRLEQPIWPHQTIQLVAFESLAELWATTPDAWERLMETLPEQMIITPGPGAVGCGAGAPPLRIDDELVFFYHERSHENVYTTRVALLDAQSGSVIAILPGSILGPELSWELDGDVDNVIFVQGAQLRGDGSIYLSYGAADRHVGAASVDARALLAALHAART
jgi:predicted GH43/DUF377 family glycosyl hydrolase